MIFRSGVAFLRVAAKNFLLVVAILSVAPAYGDEPTTGPLAGTTAAHNLIRQNLNTGVAPVPGAVAQPLACPSIPDLVWSDEVAATAQAWANGCVFAHEGGTNPYGENIAAGTTMTGPQSTVLWADEVHDPGFDYALNECPPGSPSFPGCGHYTAVAWAATTEVGCGFAACGFGDFVVCRYNPPGNVSVNTTRPYCTEAQTVGCVAGPGDPNACGVGGNQTLTVNKDGTGTGTVTSIPGGIDCGATCQANFGDNTPVQLTAAADAGSTFAIWGGDCLFAGTNPVCNNNMGTAAKNVTATFNTTGGVNHTFTVSRDGTGTGTVTSAPLGINCGATCQANFADQTPVTLTAAADAGSTFAAWGGDCAGSGATLTCLVTMDAAKNASATFNTTGGGCLDDAFETNGNNGTDDTCFGTNLGALPAGPQTHLHCDEDWVYFEATAGTTYRIETSNLIGGADTVISVHANCNPNFLDENDDGLGIGFASRLDWTAPAAGIFDVKIREFQDNYAPDGKGYDISVSEVGGCPMNLDLTNQTVTDAQTFIAQNQIMTGPAFVVSPTGNVTLTAGTAVVLGNDSSILGQLTVNLIPNPCQVPQMAIQPFTRPIFRTRF